jgi:hypothetical protein
VPGVRAHADQRGDRRAVQLEPLPVTGRSSRAQVRPERRGETAGLVGVDLQQPERADQLAQVVGGRGDDDQPPARPQHPRDLRAVARGEDDQHPVDGGRADRQPGPGVADDRQRPRVGAGRAPGGVPRGVEEHADRAGQPVEDAGQVLPGAPAEVEQRAGWGVVPRGDGVPQRAGHAGVVAGGEEGDPVGDHRRGVAGRRDVPGRQQRDVPLPCPVEGVPGRTAQSGVVRPGGQRLTADGAGQQPHRGGGPGTAGAHRPAAAPTAGGAPRDAASTARPGTTPTASAAATAPAAKAAG